MRRRASPALVLRAAFLAPLLGCAATPPPEPPPAPPPSPPPAESRELETPMTPERAETLRRETSEALRETREVLADLDAETRRERREAVAAIDDLLAQSRQALAEDDLERAQNLARKALELARGL